MVHKRKKLGLVLAGGASLGAYQVGAIKALDQLGYQFDIVTGTSIGALNGALVCAKQNDRIIDIWNKVTPETVMANGVNITKDTFKDVNSDIFKSFRTLSKNYLFNGFSVDIKPFRKFVKENIDVEACQKSNIKFGIVAVEFPSFKEMDINMNLVSKDKFLSWIHASSACTPVFPAEKIDGKTYIDGFFRDNLPIRLAFKYGADEVFAIDMRFLDLEPQHKFFLSMPNVHYIAPYIQLGSFLDFDNKEILRRIQIGYFDTMKYFHKYKGYMWTFKTNTLRSHGFLIWLYKSFDLKAKFVLEELKEDIRGTMDETDYYVRSLEILAKALGVEKHEFVHTNDEFIALIKENINHHLKYVTPLKLTKKLVKVLKGDNTNKITPKKINTITDYLIIFSSEFLNLTNMDGTPMIKESWLKHNLWKKIFK